MGLFLLLASLAWATPRVAVVDLQNRTGDSTLDGAGAGVAGVLVSKLVQVDTLEVVERDRLEAVLGEVALGKSGAVDPETAARAGKLLGATHLVTGEISSVKLPTVAITLRVVEVASGKVVTATDVVGQVGSQGEEFFVLVDDVAMRVVSALQVELGARDRIELSQVQVQRLDTIGLYGSALRALDAGDQARARELLGKALAVEPGFKLAEDTLKRIAAEVAATRAEMADATIQRVHAAWDSLERTTAGKLPPDPDPEALAAAAVRARMRLVRGDLEGYLALEQERVARTSQAAVDHRDRFESTVRSLVTDRDVRERSLREVEIVPAAVRLQMVRVHLLLGRRDAAVALLVDAYQHPGPLPSLSQRLRHPAELAERLELLDLAVIGRKQLWEAAKLRGRDGEVRDALRRLEEAVSEAETARARRAEWDALAPRLTGQRADQALVLAELTAIRGLYPDPGALRAAHQAFLARAQAGFYDPVRGTDAWRGLVGRWTEDARRPWDEPWFADQQLAVTLATWDLDPPRDDAAKETRTKKLQSLIAGAYGK